MSEPQPSGAALGEEFFARPVGQVVEDLLGCRLVVGGSGGRIVEVERYQQDDPASHSFRGPRGRAAVMFGPPGRLYVYRSYGIHWCVNLVCEPEGRGAAVLLRAVQPLWGLGRMRERRGRDGARELCSGPGKLAQALGLHGEHDGEPAATGGPLQVYPRAGGVDVVRGPRVGISQAVEQPWRLGERGSPFLSRPFPSAVAA